MGGVRQLISLGNTCVLAEALEFSATELDSGQEEEQEHPTVAAARAKALWRRAMERKLEHY